jgi:hypothetical protein
VPTAPSSLNIIKRYASVFTWTLPESCTDQRLVLAVDYPSQSANRAWLDEVLVANPELASVFSVDSGTYLYQAIYGGKRFRAAGPGEVSDPFKQAIIARCADTVACAALAGVYQAVRNDAIPTLVCGLPRPTTSPEQPLRVEFLMTERPWTPTRVCARYRACAVRLAPEPDLSCDGFTDKADGCAQQPTCGAVLECVASLERVADRPFRPVVPRRVPGRRLADPW